MSNLNPPERVSMKIEGEKARKEAAAERAKAMQRKRSAKWASENRDKIKELERTKYKATRKKYHAGWRGRNSEHYKGRMRENHLLRKFGLTAAQWEELFEAQGRCCAIPDCRAESPGARYWHTDHCHETGKVRGILCHHCNVSMGQAKDSPERLESLAAYLRSHRTIS